MKFTPSEHPSNKKPINENIKSSDEGRPKIKTPNYTTSAYQEFRKNPETKMSENQRINRDNINNRNNQNYDNLREITTPPEDRGSSPFIPRNNISRPNTSPRNEQDFPRRREPTPPMNNRAMPLPNGRMTPTPPLNNGRTMPSPDPRMTPAPPLNNNRTMRNNFTPPEYYSNNPSDYRGDMYDPYSTPFNGPVGVPLMPLYGYDNQEDADKDWEYFRQMFPSTAKRIIREVEEECDKLEYDGSNMFDEYPDRVYLGRTVDRIYNKIQDLIDEPELYTENIKSSHTCNLENVEKNELEEDDKSKDKSKEKKSDIEVKQYRRNNRRSRQNTNWLRDFIEILLYQEILNRRRRYRSRKRWF